MNSPFDEAIAAWSRALAGDNDTIDRPSIDKKIKSAKQSSARNDPAVRRPIDGPPGRRSFRRSCRSCRRMQSSAAEARPGRECRRPTGIRDRPGHDRRRAISTITLEMSVRGSVGGQRLRGRLSAGLAKPASARLEAVASFGQPAFFFVATDANATLFVPRDQRVARGRPDALLEAVAGVPLEASALRSVVTGCAGMPNVSGVQAIGDEWRVTADGNHEIYLS